MSIGPVNEENFSITVVDKIRHSISKTVKDYFNSPLHFLFYIMLSATAVGLFVGKDFNWKYYSLLIFLGIINFLLYAYDEWSTYNKDI